MNFGRGPGVRAQMGACPGAFTAPWQAPTWQTWPGQWQKPTWQTWPGGQMPGWQTWPGGQMPGWQTWPGGQMPGWQQAPVWTPTPGGGFAKQYPEGMAGIPYAWHPDYGLVQ